jgi:hypothetical protein
MVDFWLKDGNGECYHKQSHSMYEGKAVPCGNNLRPERLIALFYCCHTMMGLITSRVCIPLIASMN